MKLIDRNELLRKLPKPIRTEVQQVIEALPYVNSNDLIFRPEALDEENILESQEFGPVPWDSDEAIRSYLQYLPPLKRKDFTQNGH